MLLKHLYVRVYVVQHLLPKIIVSTSEYLEKHIDHWLDNLPDLSDMPNIRHESLRFWARQKKKDRKKPHKLLKGLCAKWLNASLDYGISQNKWPVVFQSSENKTIDLVDEFIVVVWVSYVRYMVRNIPGSYKCF